MDTSEQYIKMCDCEEIQSQRKRISEWDGKLWMFNEGGDFITNAKLARLGSERATRATSGKNSPKLVWLPRQDQLQEMVDNVPTYIEKLGNIFRAVRDFKLTERHWAEKDFPFTSMEQLWLAFVMKEKYSKVWDGQKWLEMARDN